MSVFFWPSFFMGMCAAYASMAIAVGVVLYIKRKRIRFDEQHEMVSQYDPPFYGREQK